MPLEFCFAHSACLLDGLESAGASTVSRDQSFSLVPLFKCNSIMLENAGETAISSRPYDLVSCIKNGVCFNYTTNQFEETVGKQTKRSRTLLEAINTELIDEHSAAVRHPVFNVAFSLRQAMDIGLVNLGDNTVLCSDGSFQSLTGALMSGALVPLSYPMALSTALQCRLYNSEKGIFVHPKTGTALSVAQALSGGLVAPHSATFIDVGNQKALTLREAIHTGLIDYRGSVRISDTLTVPLDDAFNCGYIVDCQLPSSLHAALQLNCYSTKSGLFNINGELVNLKDACERGFINQTEKSVSCVATNEFVSLQLAMKKGIISGMRGQFQTDTGAEINLVEAFKRGFIVNPHRQPSIIDILTSPLWNSEEKCLKMSREWKMSLAEMSSYGFMHMRRCFAFDTKESIAFSVARAKQRGILDLQRAILYDMKGHETLPLEEAIVHKLLIQLPPNSPLQEMLDNQLLLPGTSKVIDTATGQYVNLTEAIKRGSIDANSFVVRTGNSIIFDSGPHSLSTGRLDSHGNYRSENNTLSLSAAIEKGHILPSWDPMHLWTAVQTGVIDEASGLISTEPFVINPITLGNAVRAGIIIADAPAVLHDGRAMTVNQAFASGVLERQTGLLQHVDGRRLNLMNALKAGLLLTPNDGFSVYDAVSMRLFTRGDWSGFCGELTFEEAVKSGLIVVEKSRLRVSATKTISMQEALDRSILNVKNGTVKLPQDFIGPTSQIKADEQLSLVKCFRNKMLLPGTKPLPLRTIFSCDLFVQDTEKFFDPVLCAQFDLDGAIKFGLLDEQTTFYLENVKMELMPVRAAIKNELVSVGRAQAWAAHLSKWVSFPVANKYGILFTARPSMTFCEALKCGALNIRSATFADHRICRSLPLGQAIAAGFLNCVDVFVRSAADGAFIPVRSAMRTGLVDLSRCVSVHPHSGQWHPLVLRYGAGQLLTLARRQYSLDDLIDMDCVLFAAGLVKHPRTETLMHIDEALKSEMLDSMSALVKHTVEQRFVSLSSALQLKLLSAENMTFVDAALGERLSLMHALCDELLVTPAKPIDVVTGVRYGLLDAATGTWRNPFTGVSGIKLGDALRRRLLTVDGCRVIEPLQQGEFSLRDALESQLVDPVTGELVDMAAGGNISLQLAESIEQSAAAAEADTDGRLGALVEAQRRLAHVDSKGGPGGGKAEGALVTVKTIQMEVRAMEGDVARCSSHCEQLCKDGADLLSPEQFHALKRHTAHINQLYGALATKSDLMVDRLSTATTHLRQLDATSTDLLDWLSTTEAALDKLAVDSADPANMRRCRARAAELTDEIVARADALGQMQAAVAAAGDEMNGFANEQYELATLECSKITPVPSRVADMREWADQLSAARTRYDALTVRCDQMHQLQEAVDALAAKFGVSVEEAQRWLSEMNGEITTTITEEMPVGDTEALASRTDAARNLNERLASGRGKIDSVKQSGEQLLLAVDGTPHHAAQTNRVNKTCDELDYKYNQAKQEASTYADRLQSLLAQSRGVADSVKELQQFLDDVDVQTDASHPIPLVQTELEEQIRQQGVLQTSIEGRRPAIDALAEAAAKLATASPSAKRQDLEKTVADARRRYDIALRKCRSWADSLQQARHMLPKHNAAVTALLDWTDQQATLVSKAHDSAVVAAVSEQMSQGKDAQLSDCERSLNDLLNLPNVSSTDKVREEHASLQAAYDQLQQLLQMKQDESAKTKEHAAAYTTARDKVVEWLAERESQLDSLAPCALNLAMCQRQIDATEPMLDVYKGFEPQIDNVTTLGKCYVEAMQPGSSTAIVCANDSGFGASGIITSPTDTQTSGFHSFDNLKAHAAELGTVQKEVLDINQRYKMLGTRLDDRQDELSSAMAALKDYDNDRVAVAEQLADSKRKLEEIEQLPATKAAGDEALKKIDGMSKSVQKLRPSVDDCRAKVRELTRMKDADKVAGLAQLKDAQTQLETEYETVGEMCAQGKARCSAAVEFDQGYRQLKSALEAKEKMVNLMEPIASDPNALGRQLQQVDLLQDEVLGYQPQLAALHECADKAAQLARLQDADAAKSMKNRAEVVNLKWTELNDGLQKRKDKIDGARQAGLDLGAREKKLKTMLAPIMTTSEQVAAALASAGQDHEITQHAATIEELRPKLSEATAEMEGIQTVCATLAENEKDDTAKAELDARAAAARTLHGDAAKKLGQAEAQLSSAQASSSQRAAAARELQSSAESLQEALRDVSGQAEQLAHDEALREPVGRDPATLQLQQDKLGNVKSAADQVNGKLAELKKGVGQVEGKAADFGIDPTALKGDESRAELAVAEMNSKIAGRDNELTGQIASTSSYAANRDQLLSWLGETEQMALSQRHPSPDHKVVAAQVQEQKLWQKVIAERKPAVDAFAALADKLKDATDAHADKQKYLDEREEIVQRYDALSTGGERRMGNLHEAAVLAEKWSSLHSDLDAFLDDADERIKDLGTVPTDEDRLQQMLDAQKNMADEVAARRQDVDALGDVQKQLTALLASEDADDVETMFIDIQDRYAGLEIKSGEVGALLGEVADSMGEFFGRVHGLTDWMHECDHRLTAFETLPVDTDGLTETCNQLMELTNDVANREPDVSAVVEDGRELCRNTTGDDAVALQQQLDAVRAHYEELGRGVDHKLNELQKALPAADAFDEHHGRLREWLDAVDNDLQHLEDTNIEEQLNLVSNMNTDLKEMRADVDAMNNAAQQLAQVCNNEEAAAAVLDKAADAARRFEATGDAVRAKLATVQAAQQRSAEVLSRMGDLADWLNEAERHMTSAGAASADAGLCESQLRDQRLLNADIIAQKGRLRDLLAAGKKLAKELDAAGEDGHQVLDKMESIKQLAERVSQTSVERLATLEQALPLTRDFGESATAIDAWLAELEVELENCPPVVPGTHADALRKQKAHNKTLIDSLADHKDMVGKLEKTGMALAPLCTPDDGAWVRDTSAGLLSRLAAIKDSVRERDAALDAAAQESAHFTDQLDMMLANLYNAAESVRNTEPVSAYPAKLRSQIEDNCALMDEMEQRAAALVAVKEAAREVLSKAEQSDPVITEVAEKISRLDALCDEIQSGTASRNRTLADTLAVAEQFWAELQACMNTLTELRRRLDSAPPPACDPDALKEQQVDLEEVNQTLSETGPRVDMARATGETLLQLVGPDDRPEVQRSLDGLTDAFDTVTAAYHSRHSDLIEAMEKAMAFHETLAKLVKWLGGAEGKVDGFEPITSAKLETIQAALEDLESFKSETNEMGVEKERLAAACSSLADSCTAQQAAAVRRPMQDLSRRWDKLTAALAARQQALERALLEMGQFEQAFDQTVDWIKRTEDTLGEIKPTAGDLRQIEIDLAKHKVLENDVAAHEASVKSLKDAAGRLARAAGRDPAEDDRVKLLDDKWAGLHRLLADKLADLMAHKADAESFGGDLDKWAFWLDDVHAAVAGAHRPPAGLPETAKQHLDEFTQVQQDIDESRDQFEKALTAGEEYVRKSTENAHSPIGQKVKSMRTKWDQVQVKVSDRQKKLEIALREAEQLEASLNDFTEWLSGAELRLNEAPQVSRLLEPLGEQINDQRIFQDEVQARKEMAAELQSRGTKVQYYCEKKDAIPIKNALVAAKHRFEKVVSRTTERSRHLDSALTQARAYFNHYEELDKWVDEKKFWLDEQSAQQPSSPGKIKDMLEKHQAFTAELTTKQADYEQSVRSGKELLQHAPRSEHAAIQESMDTMRTKWMALSAASVKRLRALEEAMLLSGQFKEAVGGLLDWLSSAEPGLDDCDRLHGDNDTVAGLLSKHKDFLAELHSREPNVKTVRRAADELRASADDAARAEIDERVADLEAKWELINQLAGTKSEKLDDAQREAEAFHKETNSLLETLTGIEDRLKKSTVPDELSAIDSEIDKIVAIKSDLDKAAPQLEVALTMAESIQSHCHPLAEEPMTHWVSLLRARWAEVGAMAEQRATRLADQRATVDEQEKRIAELLLWVKERQAVLGEADAVPIPHEIEPVQKLIVAHGEFEEGLRGRQADIDAATKSWRTNGDPQLPNSSAEPAKDSKAKKLRKVPSTTAAPSTTSNAAGKTAASTAGQKLSDRWRSLWLASLERQRKLDDALATAMELKRLEAFSWDEWRARYMRYLNNKKSRAMDYFRRHDVAGAGRLSREEFIDAILTTKFPTTRLELGRVSDLFRCKDDENMIDYMEFINALRPDRQLDNEPKTEQEKIKDEMQHQINLCTCQAKYPITEVGQGKYRFGDNQKLRLVRILRSTVMVRVGGGWEALDEFLLKNDPCRAKGRTNMELREKFILAAGVTQTMQAFKSRPSLTPNAPGPVIKIREKTERSMPMSRSTHSHSNRSTAGSNGHQYSLGAQSHLLSVDCEVASINGGGSSAAGSTDRLRYRGIASPSLASPRTAGSASSSRPQSRGAASDAGNDLQPVAPTRIPSLRRASHQHAKGTKQRPAASPKPAWK